LGENLGQNISGICQAGLKIFISSLEILETISAESDKHYVNNSELKIGTVKLENLAENRMVIGFAEKI